MYLHNCDIPCLERRRAWFIWFLLFFGFFTSGVSGNGKLVGSFRSKTPINNILLHGDKVYVAATNQLYILNGTDLATLTQTESGPVLDSPECSPNLENCIGSRDSIQQTDNVNKIFQFLPNEKRLLICGSVRQGSCESRHPDTLKLDASSTFAASVPVSSNGPDASTIASIFIDEHGEEKLYVAASYAVDSPYREAFPAVATRSIPSLLPLNTGEIDGEASVVVRAEFRSRFRVQYVSTFTDEHYVYWTTVQNKDVKGTSPVNPMVSKLIRVCKNDDKYVSYSEIEIQCRGEDNTHYNIVRDLKHLGDDLVGVFNDAQGKNSAICVFSMPKIRLTFWYNIDRCWSGTDSIGLPHVGRDSKCINKSRLAISEDTCLFGVGGTIEASQMASAQFTDRTLTSVAARNVHGHTLVIAGSVAGDILQMEMLGEHNKRLEPYDDFVTGPDPIQKLEFVNDEHYYATSTNELLTYKISSCPEKADCNTCIAAKDPLCGFCLSEGRCIPQIECQAGLVRQCPRQMGGIEPANVSMSQVEATIFVPLEGLPAPEPQKLYECYYGAFKADARWSSNGIYCQLSVQRPQLLADQDSTVVELAVRTPTSRYNIAGQNFTFYDCARHTICSKCAQSSWPCAWCSSQQRCMSQSECSNPLQSINECPRIDVSRVSNLLVADSTNSSLSFSVLNMRSESSSGLSCSIGESPNGPKQTVQATLSSRGRVKCKTAQFKYEAEKSETNFTLELVQNQELVDKIQITVYKCGAMGTDCSQCLALDPKYHCTWCNGGCHFHEKCPVKPGKSKADILCNEPVIQSFYPMSGPIEGGTKVEIFGRDLGSRIQDVRDRVLVGNSKCRVVDYEVSVKIVCIVEGGTGSGPVRITIGQTGRRTVESVEHFRFQEPIIRSIYPTFGPLSGGTKVAIYGDNLNVGANVSIFLDNHLCTLIDDKSRSAQEIFCRTSESHRAYTVTALRLQIDDTVRVLSTNFEYRPDPSIESINPMVSFESGGRNLLVGGSNFDSILGAKIYLLSDVHSDRAVLVSDTSKCHVLNSTQMICHSPRLIKATAGRHSFNRFPIGFSMDGVKAVQNMGRKLQLTTVPDPQFAPFKGVRTLALGQPLVIEGKHLEMAATPAEYNITIGTTSCPVIVLEPTQIVCRTPDQVPQATDDFGRELKDGRSLVVVRLGHIRVEIGPLEFADASNLQASAFLRTNLLRMVMLVIFAIGLLGAAALLLFLFWRRRNSENERTYKRLKHQMDQMEANVRNECKIAFAELQTDMTEFIIDDNGVPFNERNEFTNRLLFRESIDSSILNGYGTAGIYSTRMPMAIVQFESLLYNRQFVFVLARMVESNSGISSSERSTLSSLLISAMSRDMAYCTEVVFTLLSAHIQQLAQQKSGVGLLFRRSDSLVEKMFQHWLSICLYPALMDTSGPGRQLFLLYKAVKYQCEKGPIDACTGNARYSLSESKLLRETVDSTPVTLMILPVSGFDQAPIPLKVLDCDTILQVKMKLLDLLYRNAAFSKRMTVDQFDLEWRCPRRGNILLLDDDQPQSKGLKKLHTIAYYGLQNNSVLTMQQRGPHSFTFRSESGGSSDTTCSAWSSSHLIDSNGLPVSPLGSCHQHSVQYYHLTTPNQSAFSSLPNALLSLDKRKKSKGMKRQNSQQHLFIEDYALTKNIPEVFLTRMVFCKGTIKQYIDSFFDSVTFSTADTSDVPVVLKYVFDFLDMEAARNNITDPQVVHAWKTNAYVLRFWMQLLHNADCLFDVQRQPCIDASLTVIGQTLIDVFSPTEFPLGKESPSSKLLFAKDIAKYKPVASQMFARIRQHAPVDDEKFFEYIRSMSNIGGFSAHVATSELLSWSKANVLRLSEFLDEDSVALKLRLGERLQESVRSSLLPNAEPEHVYATLQ